MGHDAATKKLPSDMNEHKLEAEDADMSVGKAKPDLMKSAVQPQLLVSSTDGRQTPNN